MCETNVFAVSITVFIINMLFVWKMVSLFVDGN